MITIYVDGRFFHRPRTVYFSYSQTMGEYLMQIDGFNHTILKAPKKEGVREALENAYKLKTIEVGYFNAHEEFHKIYHKEEK